MAPRVLHHSFIYRRFLLLEMSIIVVALLAMVLIQNTYQIYSQIERLNGELIEQQHRLKEDLLVAHVLMHEHKEGDIAIAQWKRRVDGYFDGALLAYRKIIAAVENEGLAFSSELRDQLEWCIDAVRMLSVTQIESAISGITNMQAELAFDQSFESLMTVLERNTVLVENLVKKERTKLEASYEELLTGLLLLALALTSLFVWYHRHLMHVNQKLRDTRVASDTVTENLVDGVVTMNKQGVIISVNSAVGHFFGYEREELVGQPVTILMPEMDAKRHDHYVRTHLQTGVKKIIGIGREVTGRRKDGSEFPIYLGVSSFTVNDQPVFTAVLRDISDAKRYESELLRAKEQAEVGSRAKSEFLSGMTHEVRTPLNGIMGLLELLQTSDLSDADREYIKVAYQSAESLLVLLEDMLEFSRMEDGNIESNIINFQLNDFCAGLIRPHREAAEQKHLALSYVIENNAPDVVCSDPLLLHRAMDKLLDNAIKFTEQGSVVLKVAKTSESEQTVNLRFSVQDTGVGVPENIQRVIFEPFQQGDGSMTRRFGGTGLGLAICRKLAGAMDASLGVESAENGSCFWLEITVPKPESVDVAA